MKGYKSMMNVIILDSHPEEDTRIEKHIEYLIDHDFVVYRIHFDFYKEHLGEGYFSYHGEKGYRITSFPFNGRFTCVYCLRKRILINCIESLNELNCDFNQSYVIHVHDTRLLYLASRLVRTILPESKIVYDRHEVYEQYGLSFERSIVALFENLAKNSIKGIVTVSENHESNVRTLFPHSNVITIPNYPSSVNYDTKIIEDKIQSFDEFSQISAVYIGSLGIMDRDVDFLLKTADAILNSFKNAKFIIGGTNLDNRFKNKIEDLSKKYGIRFQFLGYVPRKITIEFTQKSHLGFLLINPKTHYWVKTSPNKVFEYLICGVVPIVRADIDNAAAFHEYALIFDRFESEEKIISAILDLLGNPKRLKTFMESAREASINYRWDVAANRYIDLYNLLFSQKSNLN
jgi:glycosyltransferase involved in cell wall biosynthesis